MNPKLDALAVISFLLFCAIWCTNCQEEKESSRSDNEALTQEETKPKEPECFNFEDLLRSNRLFSADYIDQNSGEIIVKTLSFIYIDSQSYNSDTIFYHLADKDTYRLIFQEDAFLDTVSNKYTIKTRFTSLKTSKTFTEEIALYYDTSSSSSCKVFRIHSDHMGTLEPGQNFGHYDSEVEKASKNVTWK